MPTPGSRWVSCHGCRCSWCTISSSTSAYLTALSVSAYSLTALLRAAQPMMENRPDGASAIGLTYLGGDRVVPHYGGGMSTAKAALQIDARQLAHNLGGKNIRVNCISAGPYASRAARSRDRASVVCLSSSRTAAAIRQKVARSRDSSGEAAAINFLRQFRVLLGAIHIALQI